MQTLDGRRTLAHSHKTCVCVCVYVCVCARVSRHYAEAGRSLTRITYVYVHQHAARVRSSAVRHAPQLTDAPMHHIPCPHCHGYRAARVETK